MSTYGTEVETRNVIGEHTVEHNLMSIKITTYGTEIRTVMLWDSI